MKVSILFIFISLFQSSVFASNECTTTEGQVIATVTRVETDSMIFCKAYISIKSISHYSAHMICPLSIDSVVEEGIIFPLVNGHDCEVYVGDSISGYLLSNGKSIYLD